MAHAHVQLVLYRPFLHYISPNSTSNPVDRRSYDCALACVRVSRNIVHVTEEMKKRGLLNGAYWFTMYTTLFAILSLVFFTLENENDPSCALILKDVTDGRDTLAGFAKRSQAADRCTRTLNVSSIFPGYSREACKSKYSFLYSLYLSNYPTGFEEAVKGRRLLKKNDMHHPLPQTQHTIP
jgi:hypothetical protein